MVDGINKLETENKKIIEDFNNNLTKLDETQKIEYSGYSSELLNASVRATDEDIRALFISKITDSIEKQLETAGDISSPFYTLLKSQKDKEIGGLKSLQGGNNNSKSKKNRKSNKNKTKKRKGKKSNSRKFKFVKVKKNVIL